MSENEKSVRIIPFSGKKADWRIWSKRFLAAADKKKYKEVLLGKEVIPKNDEVLDESVDADKSKIQIRKANANAYHDLVLANSEIIPFNIIDMADGDSSLAWKRLNAKYESKTKVTMNKLLSDFSESKLEDSNKDP